MASSSVVGSGALRAPPLHPRRPGRHRDQRPCCRANVTSSRRTKVPVRPGPSPLCACRAAQAVVDPRRNHEHVARPAPHLTASLQHVVRRPRSPQRPQHPAVALLAAADGFELHADPQRGWTCLDPTGRSCTSPAARPCSRRGSPHGRWARQHGARSCPSRRPGRWPADPAARRHRRTPRSPGAGDPQAAHRAGRLRPRPVPLGCCTSCGRWPSARARRCGCCTARTSGSSWRSCCPARPGRGADPAYRRELRAGSARHRRRPRRHPARRCRGLTARGRLLRGRDFTLTRPERASGASPTPSTRRWWC
jgi:hypothetical protein